jgi:hypothetical protein
MIFGWFRTSCKASGRYNETSNQQRDARVILNLALDPQRIVGATNAKRQGTNNVPTFRIFKLGHFPNAEGRSPVRRLCAMEIKIKEESEGK